MIRNGRDPILRGATTGERRDLAAEKIRDEVAELVAVRRSDAAGVALEAADVIEAVIAYASVSGVTREQVQEAVEFRRETSGGFDNWMVYDGHRLPGGGVMAPSDEPPLDLRDGQAGEADPAMVAHMTFAPMMRIEGA